MATSITSPDGVTNACDEILGPPLARGQAADTALIDDHGSLSYAGLNALVNRFGNALRGRGVEPENRVLFLCSDSIRLVAAYLASMRIGAVAVAFNLRAAPEELLYVIRDSRCKILFLDGRFADVYESIRDRIGFELSVVYTDRVDRGLSAEALLDGQSEHLESTPMSADDMAFWIYTSGTTGKPKAAVHLQHDVLLADRHLCENLGVGPGDRIFCSSKLFFAYALAHALFGALRAGATSVLYGGWPDPAEVARVVRTHRPSLVFSVPTLYRNLLRDGSAADPAFAEVRHFISAGEKLPESLFDQWRRVTGKPILEGLGTSETVYLFFVNSADNYRRGSCGRLVPWAEARLIDETGAGVDRPGQTGVLWLRMASVCDRYWNRQEQSRATFEGFWYRTGDVFSFDADGWWYHQGRSDDMLKISGQWVSPVEIEAAALAVDGVTEAAVVGASNPDGLVRAVLFLVPAAGDGDNQDLVERVRSQLIERLAVYKCPRRIEVIDEVPRTATGKIQRFKLRQLARITH